MLPLVILATSLQLVSGAALHPRQNSTNPGGPITNVTSISPGGPVANVTSVDSGSPIANITSTASSSALATSTVNPGGPIANTTSVIPGGPVQNATITSASTAATSTSTAIAPAGNSSEFIACVSDSSIASLVSSQGLNSTSRDSCSDTCISEGTEQVAYFDDADNLCYCVSEDEAPSSGEVVYAVDAEGNCRSADDASVEYLYAPYPFSSCYLTVNTTLATSLFSVGSPVECFDGCDNAVIETVGVRPRLNSATKEFEYLCSCYSSIVDGNTATDCGFGITAIYRA